MGPTSRAGSGTSGSWADGLDPLDDRHVPGILGAFNLEFDGHLSNGPVARGRLGSIWRLDTNSGTWAVKQVIDPDADELAEIIEGARFQEAAFAAGVPTPAVRRTRTGHVIATIEDEQVQLQAWVDLRPPALDLDAADLGRLVAALHRGVHGHGGKACLVRGAGRRVELARNHPRAPRGWRAVHRAVVERLLAG